MFFGIYLCEGALSRPKSVQRKTTSRRMSTVVGMSGITRTKKGKVDKTHWRSDSGVQACWRCQATFSAFRRKHHCRRCGEIFCADCAPAPQSKGVRECLDCTLITAAS